MSEIDAVTAERNRAQKSCEQMGERIAKMERALRAIMEAAELGDTDACHELARLALT